MLLSVVGSSGLGEVAGVPADSPAALLRVVADRPDQHVLLLTPVHAAAAARRQAELVAAARPTGRIEVLISRHHALTLTLVAAQLLRSSHWMPSIEDGMTAAQTTLATARSLVWCPSAWSLRGVDLTLGDRLRSLRGGRGFFLELGSPARLAQAHRGWHPRAGDHLYAAAPAPALLVAQLGEHPPQQVDIEIHDGAPYAPRSARILTALQSSAGALSPTVEAVPARVLDESGESAGTTDRTRGSEAA